MSKATHDQAAPLVPATMTTPTERAGNFVVALRRRWPIALLVFVLTLASAVALTHMQQKKYEATAQILLQPTDAVQGVVSPGSVSSPADAQRDINTYAQMITVDPVADAVRHQLGLKTALPALVSRISVVGQNPGDQLMEAAHPVHALRQPGRSHRPAVLVLHLHIVMISSPVVPDEQHPRLQPDDQPPGQHEHRPEQLQR